MAHTIKTPIHTDSDRLMKSYDKGIYYWESNPDISWTNINLAINYMREQGNLILCDLARSPIFLNRCARSSKSYANAR